MASEDKVGQGEESSDKNEEEEEERGDADDEDEDEREGGGSESSICMPYLFYMPYLFAPPEAPCLLVPGTQPPAPSHQVLLAWCGYGSRAHRSGCQSQYGMHLRVQHAAQAPFVPESTCSTSTSRQPAACTWERHPPPPPGGGRLTEPRGQVEPSEPQHPAGRRGSSPAVRPVVGLRWAACRGGADGISGLDNLF
jgi:hypothetical protein